MTDGRSQKEHAAALPDASARAAMATRVTEEHTRLLVANLPLSLAVTLVVGAMLAFAMAPAVSPVLIAIWYALLVAVCAGRFAVWFLYNRSTGIRLGSSAWLAACDWGAFASGLAWGTSSVLLMPHGDPARQVFLGFVLASMGAGGMTTLAVRMRPYILFLLPALMPYALAMALEGGEVGLLMSSIFILGQGFLIANARRFEAVTTNGLYLHFENAHLVAALRDALARAEAGSRAKSQFLANMSHEIRTPLSGILGMAELLGKTGLTRHQTKLVANTSGSAAALLTLVEDVLDLSSIEAGTFTLAEQSFSVRDCIEDAVSMCAAVGFRKGLDIHLITDGPLPGQLIGDGPRLRQVLVNLLANAVKFTASGRIALRIATSTSSKPGACSMTFQVIDTGIGIAEGDLARVMLPFTQADASTQRRFGGSGLGLAVTRHLVGLMGGEVLIDSVLGSGTTVAFTIELPYPGPALVLETSPPFLTGRRVLILDDRPWQREAMAAHVAGTDVVIEHAASSAHALAVLHSAAARGEPIDLLICDRVAPRMNNLPFLEQIRDIHALHATALVALVPAGCEIDASREATLSCRLVNKPARRSEVLEAITEAAAMLEQRAASGPEAEPAADAGAPSSLSGVRVLLAEDNIVNQEVALAYLGALGCSTTLVENGVEALAAHAAQTFDIVLMDCQMPELDGLSAIREIRRREEVKGAPRLPILMVTANAFESDRELAFAAGADDFLCKPYTEIDLERLIGGLIAAATRKVAA